jgi:hypothetical protein
MSNRIQSPVTPSSVAVLALACMTVGCAGPDPDPVMSRDSAGISIMLSNAPAWDHGQEWSVGSEPTLTLGGIAGQRAYHFTSVGEARILEVGHLLVTHCSNPPEVRLYRSDGYFLRAFGGEGTIDGQCRFILRSWMAGGDTLLVYDPTLGRLNQFDLRGTLLSVAPVPSGPEAIVWVDRLADGRLLGRPNNPQPSADGRSRARFSYSLLDPGSLSVEPFVEADGAEFVVSQTASGERVVEQVLFAPFTTAAARGSSVYLSDTRDFWIDERGPDGSLLRRFGRHWTADPIGRKFRREYRDQRAAAAGAGGRAVRQELGRAVFADRWPAHEPIMMVDADDHLWVLHMPGGRGEDRRWSVFAPDGRWLGEVRTPAGLRVTAIGHDRLIGVWQDSGDGQTVRVYPLIKPEPAAADRIS